MLDRLKGRFVDRLIRRNIMKFNVYELGNYWGQVEAESRLEALSIASNVSIDSEYGLDAAAMRYCVVEATKDKPQEH